VGVVATPGIKVEEKSVDLSYEIPEYEVLGSRHPVGARATLRGRDKIIMTEWGPWDHRSPLVRLIQTTPGEHVYEVHGVDGDSVQVSGVGITRQEPGVKSKNAPWTLRIRSSGPGVATYRIHVAQGSFRQDLQGSIVDAQWDVTVFSWPREVDPREHLEEWRRLASGPGAMHARASRLEFRYGGGGPSQVGLSDEITAAGIPGDHFGTIARTTLPLPKGRWKITTTSDDGVRVSVNGKPVIENWTWHAPARDEGDFESDGGPAEVVVEHFEIDGYSVLEFSIEPAP
jgi:hypothetical protein